MTNLAAAVERLIVDCRHPFDGGVHCLSRIDDVETILAELGGGASGEVYRCDFCGHDYTSEKYCCQQRRDYLAMHGEHETPRPPAAGLAELTDEQWYSLWDAMDDIQIPPCNFKDTIELKAAMAKAAREFLGKVDG